VSIVFEDEVEAYGEDFRKPAISDRLVLCAAAFGLGLVSLGWIAELWPTSEADLAPSVAALSEQSWQEAATALPPADFIPDVSEPKPTVLDTVEPKPTGPALRPSTAVPAPGVPLPPRRPVFADDETETPAPEAIPMPPRRPSDLRVVTPSQPVTPPPATRVARNVAVPAPAAAPTPQQQDNRGLLERLFNIGGNQQPAQQRQRGTVLAYARPDTGGLIAPDRPNPALDLDRYTAYYDIRSRTVTLPNGTRLEAHSGLGPHIDDVNKVHIKNEGPTPPNVYDLKLREKIFHGVRAIRMIPVGEGNMYGRDGILAHSYLLGPNGDSNGCMSIRDYDRFLQAFLNGEVKRVVVRGG
jgi:hypothetical protein